MDVYIDGVLDSEKSKPVGPEIEMVSLTFSGEQGSITVSIQFGNYIVKQYVIYFDNCTYREF